MLEESLSNEDLCLAGWLFLKLANGGYWSRRPTEITNIEKELPDDFDRKKLRKMIKKLVPDYIQVHHGKNDKRISLNVHEKKEIMGVIRSTLGQ